MFEVEIGLDVVTVGIERHASMRVMGPWRAPAYRDDRNRAFRRERTSGHSSSVIE